MLLSVFNMHNMPQISYQTERSDQGMREHMSDGRPVWNQVIKKASFPLRDVAKKNNGKMWEF